MPVVTVVRPPEVRRRGVEGQRDVRGEARGEHVGATGDRAALVDRARAPARAARRAPAGCRRSRPCSPRRTRARGAGCDGPATRCAARANGARYFARAGERHHRVEVERVAGSGDERALEAARGAGEDDALVGFAATDRLGERETRVDVAAGARGRDRRPGRASQLATPRVDRCPSGGRPSCGPSSSITGRTLPSRGRAPPQPTQRAALARAGAQRRPGRGLAGGRTTSSIPTASIVGTSAEPP